MRRALLGAALVLIFVPGAGAQSLLLTESEALARLSNDSPRVRAIRASVDVARVEVLAARRNIIVRSMVHGAEAPAAAGQSCWFRLARRAIRSWTSPATAWSRAGISFAPAAV